MRNYKGEFTLLLTAIIWGTTIVSQKVGMDYVKPFTFGTAKFFIGAILLIPLILIFDGINKKKNIQQIKDKANIYINKDLLVGGTLCGVALFMGASLQQWGIIYTTAGKAGFITALYIILVPVFGIFLRRKVGIIVWIGVLLAMLGLYLLCIEKGFAIQIGDAIVLAGTIFWALQILIIDAYVDKADGIKLSFVQFIVAGILSTVAAFISEHPSLDAIIAGVWPILFTAIFGVGIAFTLQIVGQKDTDPTVASIILSMESVFAVISGTIFLKEFMSARELIGCIIMFVAVIITQINWENKFTAKEENKDCEYGRDSAL